ncbi:MAG: leucine-rich repeat domain-containing protein [Muribaculaceae bacterium]|nr:leucine-rich repeat domain-containing protein [Muribaculaceae bacterium]
MYSNQLPVVAIGYSAFKNCTNLTKVELPNTITEIKEYAFFI